MPEYDRQPEVRRSKGLGAGIVAAGAVGAKLGLLKVLVAVGSMAVSVWAYAQVDGLTVAVAIVGLLLAHELGHWIAYRAAGVRPAAMIFVPFLGAAVFSRRGAVLAPLTDGLIALAGPVAGGAASAALLPLSTLLPAHWVLLHELAHLGLLLNALQLIPLGPLDGGHVLRAFARARRERERLALGGGGLALAGALVVGAMIVPGAATVSASDAGLYAVVPIKHPAGMPDGIAVAPDGTVWFTEREGNRIGRIDALTGAESDYAIPTRRGRPLRIAVAPGGDVWFTESLGGKVGHIDRAGHLSEIALPHRDPYPYDIAIGPDGAAWFAELNAGLIGRVSLPHHLSEYALPRGINPSGMAVGADGALWFVEDDQAHRGLGRITVTGRISEYALPLANSGPQSIAAGGDGMLYATLVKANAVLRINPFAPRGMTVIPLPAAPHIDGTPYAATMQPFAIARGPFGMWLTLSSFNSLASVDASGRVARYFSFGADDQSRTFPDIIAQAPDGTLWYTAEGQHGNTGWLMHLLGTPSEVPASAQS